MIRPILSLSEGMVFAVENLFIQAVKNNKKAPPIKMRLLKRVYR
jgi:hypothetical protein